MVAHVTVPALDPKPNTVATISPVIVSDLLKQQLHFHGLVITDALDMAGLTRLYANDIGREAVDAFKAGNDMLLIPPDLDAAYRAVLAAVRSGEIPEARLNDSVLKILKAKASLQLERARLVDLSSLERTVGTPEHVAAGEQIADDAVTLVRQNGAVLPLKKSGTAPNGLPYQNGVQVRNRIVVVIFSDDVRLQAGHVLERAIRGRVPDVNVIYTDAELAPLMAPSILNTVKQAEKVVIAVYASPSAGRTVKTANGVRSSAAVAEESADLLEEMLKTAGGKSIVLAMGNPYLAKDFPEVQNYLCTFSAAPVSEVSAAKALFGEIEIHGHLPVTIPGMAARGAGIIVPVQQQ
jgi:beta-N-acetylhexosaminidase